MHVLRELDRQIFEKAELACDTNRAVSDRSTLKMVPRRLESNSPSVQATRLKLFSDEPATGETCEYLWIQYIVCGSNCVMRLSLFPM